MTISQQVITISLCVLGTVATRFLPFVVFGEKRETPVFVRHVGALLPSAVFGMLVVYCLRNVNIATGAHGLFELISIVVTGAFHLWRRNMILSIAGGTACYMLLLHFIPV